MTDKDIVKALEYCYGDQNNCKRCPYMEEDKCHKVHTRDVLDLINSQKAEIERLKNNVFCKVVIDEETMRSIINEKVAEFELDIASIKAEAIKEFAKELINRFSKNNLTQGFYVNLSEIALINLVKEMAGDAE